MRPTRLVAVALLVALPSGAGAVDVRTMTAVQGMVTTAPTGGSGATLTDAEAGLRLRLDLLRMAGRVDFRGDFWGRLGIKGNPTVQELRQLSLTIRDLGGRLDVTLGRFHTPGGFWLIADGARLDLRYTDWLTHSVYGGLRSFTTDRRNALLSIDSPVLLPVAGTALWFRHRVFDLSLTFTWAQEAIYLLNPKDPAIGPTRRERHVEDEFFLDAQLLVLPSPTVTLTAGASLGTRYDVGFAVDNPVTRATLGVSALGAVSGWGMIDWRPIKRLRLQYSANYERIRLIESEQVFLKPDGERVQNANGSFLDNQLRASLLVWRALRVDLTYRLRARENTDLEHRALAGLRGDDLWRGLGLFASVGLDVIQPGVKTLRRVRYSGGFSFVKPWLDLRAGILFTDGIGSGLLFSQARGAMPGGGITPTQLFPYVLESNRIAFVRLFATWRGAFIGLDVEENLDSVQLRAMAQIGYAR